MKVRIVLFVLVLGLFMIFPTSAYAEHVLDIEAFGQYLDISQLEAEKFTFEFDEISYDVYFGYSGSLDDSFTEHIDDPAVQDMIINQERKSIEVIFGNVPKTTDFWVRIPFEVLTADNEKYQLFINGADTGYDLMKMPDGYVIGMIIDEDTTHVEIVGTHVIPEFGTYAILILASSVIASVYFTRKSHFANWTRIN